MAKLLHTEKVQVSSKSMLLLLARCCACTHTLLARCVSGTAHHEATYSGSDESPRQASLPYKAGRIRTRSLTDIVDCDIALPTNEPP